MELGSRAYAWGSCLGRAGSINVWGLKALLSDCCVAHTKPNKAPRASFSPAQAPVAGLQPRHILVPRRDPPPQRPLGGAHWWVWPRRVEGGWGQGAGLRRALRPQSMSKLCLPRRACT